MGTPPSERKGFTGTAVEDAGEPSSVLPLENRDMFAQLATHGRLPGRNVELRFVPIHDLQRHRVTTFFCTPASFAEAEPSVHGYKAFGGVGLRELPFIDRAILAHAVKFARRLAASGTVAAVGTSVHFETLAWSKGREIYQHALRAAGVADYPFLVLNIEEIPSGVGSARLAEIVAAVRPYLKRIFLHLPDMETSVQHCGHLGVSGLTLSLPPRPTRVLAMGTAKWLMRECEAQSAHACVKEINCEMVQEILTLAGVRFGAGTALESREFHGNAHPADIEAYLTEAHAVEDRKSSGPKLDEHLHA